MENPEVSRKGARRGLKALSFEATIGPGIIIYLAEFWWAFVDLNLQDLGKLTTALRTNEFAKTRQIVQSDQAASFVDEAQKGFHRRHGLAHLNEGRLKGVDTTQQYIQPKALLPALSS
jgi:hypothetical protein